jgi:hypothetical protein
MLEYFRSILLKISNSGIGKCLINIYLFIQMKISSGGLSLSGFMDRNFILQGYRKLNRVGVNLINLNYEKSK